MKLAVFFILGTLLVVSGQKPQDPYTIDVANNNFDQANQEQLESDRFKNGGARPSFRQYSNGGYQGQQQYGYSNGNQYSPYDSSQQWNAGQRYPQYNNGQNQNGFQRDPRFNGSPSPIVTTSAALLSFSFLTLMHFVLN